MEGNNKLKCPNCGSEAINVNGKYVCLDCGIEISPNQRGDELGDSLEPSISNHAPISQEPTSFEVPQTPVSPAINEVTQEPAAPVKEAFLSELNQEESHVGAGVYDFSEPTPNAPISDFPASTASAQTSQQDLPQDKSEIAQSEAAGELTIPDVPQVAELTPETPVPTESETLIPQEPEHEYFQPSKLNISPSSEESLAPQASDTVDSNIPGKEEEMISQEEPSLDSAKVEAPSFVQPITDSQPETVPAGPETLTSVIETPTAIEDPQTIPVNTQPEPIVSVPAETTPRVTPGENLDDLLDKYSAPQPDYPPAVSAIPNGPTAFDSVRQTSFPSTESQNVIVGNGMPSTESVFGSEGLDDPTLKMEKNQAKNKKLRMIIMIGGGVVLLLLIILGVVLGQQKAQKTAQEKREQLVQSIMTGVSQKMDEPLDVKVSFRHSLDFSTVSLKPKVDPDLGKTLLSLFSAPIINEGRWDTNNNGDILQANKAGATFYEQVYIDQEKMTYFKENGVWGKKQGREITAIPVLFSAIERGSIFYPSKFESLELVNVEEDEEGQTLTTLRVKPKSDYLKELIGAVTPALLKVNYQTIDASQLVIDVVVDESDYIQGVTAKGDINVVCDYFEGKISVDSEAVYEYSASEIQKPEISQKTPLIILTNTVVQGDFEAVPQKEETEGRG